jgi:hypothetical protein
MRVEVQIKKGRKFNRRENGELKTYVEGKRLTVSQHVYETFKDAFELLGEAPPEVPVPVSDAPGTDDQPTLLEQVVRALAGVGLNVDPVKAAAWTEADLERLPKLIERTGKNPPKFVLEALLPKEPDPAADTSKSQDDDAGDSDDEGENDGQE